MSLIKTFIEIICFHHALSFNISPGVPLPHADELDDILNRRVFANSTDVTSNSVFDYLFGDYYNLTGTDEAEAEENLDISILDPETLTKIVQAARKKQLAFKPSRRQEEIGKAYEYIDFFNNRTLEFMRQSIYDTRSRLVVTRPIRKKYQHDIHYNIGIIYGTLIQMRIKIDNVYAALRKMEWWYGFIWHLFLYQRCVALNVDIEFGVQRMFDFHKKWRDKFGSGEDDDYEAVGQSITSVPGELSSGAPPPPPSDAPNAESPKF